MGLAERALVGIGGGRLVSSKRAGYWWAPPLVYHQPFPLVVGKQLPECAWQILQFIKPQIRCESLRACGLILRPISWIRRGPPSASIPLPLQLRVFFMKATFAHGRTCRRCRSYRLNVNRLIPPSRSQHILPIAFRRAALYQLLLALRWNMSCRRLSRTRFAARPMNGELPIISSLFPGR